MRSDTGPAFAQAHPMILFAEYGLHFAKEGDHWRCVEYPEIEMLSGVEQYRVNGLTFATLDGAVRQSVQRVWRRTSPRPTRACKSP